MNDSWHSSICNTCQITFRNNSIDGKRLLSLSQVYVCLCTIYMEHPQDLLACATWLFNLRVTWPRPQRLLYLLQVQMHTWLKWRCAPIYQSVLIRLLPPLSRICVSLYLLCSLWHVRLLCRSCSLSTCSPHPSAPSASLACAPILFWDCCLGWHAISHSLSLSFSLCHALHTPTHSCTYTPSHTFIHSRLCLQATLQKMGMLNELHRKTILTHILMFKWFTKSKRSVQKQFLVIDSENPFREIACFLESALRIHVQTLTQCT